MKTPRIVIIVAPRERAEALDAYKDRLSPEDIEKLLTAPSTDFVRISLKAHQLERRG